MDLIRKDIRTEKQSVVDQAMGLEAGDKAKFWPIYEKYQKEQSGLWDRRIANIKKYAESYPNVPDGVADQLATNALETEQQASAVRRKYYSQMKAALGPKVAARFLQVEGALNHLMELQVMSEIPLIK
jgi:hypothetical protein